MYKKPAFQPPKAKSGSSLTSDSSDGEVKASHKPNLAGDGDQHLGGMLMNVIIMDKIKLCHLVSYKKRKYSDFECQLIIPNYIFFLCKPLN